MTDLAVGDLLDGRYRIDHPIARGGMATVYRCVDVRLNRAVAAKVMHDHIGPDPTARRRFRHEARAMAQLHHPNVVDVYDFSSTDEATFLVMELITGGTLRELLAERGPFSPELTTAVLRKVLAGLSAAHSKGMIHRDIKPDNILITTDQEIKVADFGLVRAARTAHQPNGEIVGTAAYLAPEQVTGADMSAATDVYSTGIVAFELLTGRVPFTGDTPLAQAYAHVNNDVPLPSRYTANVPGLYDELVATATARDPRQRFADAHEFLAAIDDVARELWLPTADIPVPRNAAARRAAAVPTDLDAVFATIHVMDVHDSAQTRVVPPAASPSVTPPTQQVEPVATTMVGPAPAAVASPATPPTVRPMTPPLTNRSGWSLALTIILGACAIGAVLLGSWWFGSGLYNEVPTLFSGLV